MGVGINGLHTCQVDVEAGWLGIGEVLVGGNAAAQQVRAALLREGLPTSGRLHLAALLLAVFPARGRGPRWM
eukprot:3744192-Lingulodinium_polyedra.AAC.1